MPSFPLNFLPGTQRDGTQLDADRATDSLWTRWRLGRPRSMGGFQQITGTVTGVPRRIHMFYQGAQTIIHVGTSSGLFQFIIDSNSGALISSANRTPATFAAGPDVGWTLDAIFDTTSNIVQLVAHAVADLSFIAQAIGTIPFIGQITASTPLSQLSNPGPSSGEYAQPVIAGGIVCVQPYVFDFDINGMVGWSAPNLPLYLGVTGGTSGAGSARISAQKIVAGASLRGGGANSPAGLFWSLSELISATYIGGSGGPYFAFNTVSPSSSILSTDCVIEYDSLYFWAGVDRFLVYNGTVVEVPNTQNQDWFFNNLNWAYAGKTFAFKVPRYGEIWWCAPMFGNTEPSHAIIFNVRENCWYDTVLPNGGRSCGYFAQGFRYPVMGGAVSTGGNMYSLWLHESGNDQVLAGQTSIVRKYYETPFFPAGPKAQNPTDDGVSLQQLEPDIIQTADMFAYQIGEANVRSAAVFSPSAVPIKAIPLVPEEQMVSFTGPTSTNRLTYLHVESNAPNGSFITGRNILHTEDAEDMRRLGGIANPQAVLPVNQQPPAPPGPPTPPAPPVPGGSFVVSPTSIASGGSATLTWTSSNATSAFINNGVGNVTPVVGGSVTVSPGVTETYTLTLTGPSGTTTFTGTVTVVAVGAPTGTFAASPAGIISGNPTTLTWTSSNATSASISNGVGSVTPVAGGSISVSPTSTETYTLTLTGPGGTTTYMTTVTVAAAGVPSGTFVASPVSITSGGSATLTWISANSTGASINNGVGTVTPVAGGSVTVSPTSTQTYVLTLTGPGGTTTYSASVTVMAAAMPTGTFVASPTSITSGGSATLTWTSANATSASINNGVGTVSPVAGGSVTVSPTSTATYTLTLTGPGGTITYSATVTVSVASAVLTTITIVNTSGSAVAPGAIPPTFGHPFKQGDIPAGQYPQLQTTVGNTPVPATIYQPNYHPDGSWAECSFIIRLPVGIPASSSISINVMSGGTAPPAGSRSLSDLTAGGLNLQTVVTGVGTAGNLTGTWNSILAHGISNTNQSNSSAGADIETYGTGPVGNVYKIRASLESAGSPHGFLETDWYCIPLEDQSNGLYGIRFLPKMKMDWYDTSVTKVFAAFSTLQLYNGATLLLDMMAGTNPAFGVGQTFTATNGNANLTLPSSADVNEVLGLFGSTPGAQIFCVATTTGTLPGNLALNTPYWAQAGGTSSQVTLNAAMAAYGITPSGSGTGTHTLTPYPYVAPFSGETFAPGTGKYNYIQGGGSVAADAPLRIQISRAYWASTGYIPPYTATLTPTATPNPVPVKTWNIVYPMYGNQGITGGRPDIGPVTAYAANHIWTQSANDEQAVRVIGLIGTTENYCLRSATYRSIPVCNNNTYGGMPPANRNFQWDGSNAAGITDPPAIGPGTATAQVWTGNDFSHKPEMVAYAYMFTGEVDKLDMLMNLTAGTLMNLYPGPDSPPNTGIAVANGTYNDIGGVRNSTSISGTAYYGHLTGGQQGRYSAWALRTTSLAQSLAQSHPENANYAKYASDIGATTMAAWSAFKAIQPSFVTTNGLFNIWNNTSTAPWQVYAYLSAVMAWRIALTGDSNTLSMLNYIMEWPATWYTTWGSVYAFPYYEQLTKAGTNGNAAPSITSLAQVGVSDLGGDVSWTTGGFTLQTVLSGNYVIANGDVINFDANYGVPGGYTANVPMYVVGLSGSGVGATFGLSLTSGGSPVAPSNSSSGNEPCYFNKPPGNNWPSTGFLLGSGGTENYSTIIPTAMRWCNAVGVTMNASMYADMQTRFNSYGVNFTAEPQWDTAAAL